MSSATNPATAWVHEWTAPQPGVIAPLRPQQGCRQLRCFGMATADQPTCSGGWDLYQFPFILVPFISKVHPKT